MAPASKNEYMRCLKENDCLYVTINYTDHLHTFNTDYAHLKLKVFTKPKENNVNCCKSKQ